MAFEIAGRWRSARRPVGQARRLLEPMMKVEVVTPEDYMGDVIGDLSPSWARSGMEERGRRKVVNAMVPLREHVRLCQRTLRSQPGPCQLHNAVRSLRRGAAGRAEEVAESRRNKSGG